MSFDLWTPAFKAEMRNKYMSSALSAAGTFVWENSVKLPEMLPAGGAIYGEMRWATGAQFIEKFRALTDVFEDDDPFKAVGNSTSVQINAVGDNLEFVKSFTRGNETGEISVTFTVRVLLGYDADYSDISGVSDSVKLGAAQYIREGRKIAAIKYIRERTGMGLRDAKSVADSLADDPAYMSVPDAVSCNCTDCVPF